MFSSLARTDNDSSLHGHRKLTQTLVTFAISHVSFGQFQLTCFQNTGEMLWQDGSSGLNRPVNPSSLSPWASPTGTPGGQGKIPRAQWLLPGMLEHWLGLSSQKTFCVWVCFVQKSLRVSRAGAQPCCGAPLGSTFPRGLPRNLRINPLWAPLSSSPQLGSLLSVPSFLFLASLRLAKAYPGSQPQDLRYWEQEPQAKFLQGESAF